MLTGGLEFSIEDNREKNSDSINLDNQIKNECVQRSMVC